MGLSRDGRADLASPQAPVAKRYCGLGLRGEAPGTVLNMQAAQFGSVPAARLEVHEIL